MSIGQFVVQVTPIQIARAYAAIANGGYLVTPHLSKISKQLSLINEPKKIDFDPENINLIKKFFVICKYCSPFASCNYFYRMKTLSNYISKLTCIFLIFFIFRS